MANDNSNVRCLNKGRPVYFSYARNSSKKPEWEHISDCVDKVLELFDAQNIEYRLDKKDIGTGDKISAFEEEIGWNSEIVVLVFSDKYFRSMHCMYEFTQIRNAYKQFPNKKMMCIKSGDFDLSDPDYIMDLDDFWRAQKQKYEKIEFHRLREHSGVEKAAYQNGFYFEDIRYLYTFFSAINYQNASSINYESFLGDIAKYFTTTPKPLPTPRPPQFVNPEPAKTIYTPPQYVNPEPAKPIVNTSYQQRYAVSQPRQAAVVTKPKKHRFLKFVILIIVLLCLLGMCGV